MFFTNLSSKEFYLNKYLKKWPDCNMDNYKILNKTNSDGLYMADQTYGSEIFIINGKKKRSKDKTS